MFVMYFPQMIEAGMVYKAIPPLFAVKEGKKSRYFSEQIDIVRFVQKAFLIKYKLQKNTKTEMQNKEITIFFLRNTDYIYHLEKVSNTYAVNPELLEMTLFNYIANGDKFDQKKLNKDVSSKYRFMSAYKEGNITVVKGTIDKSNLIICNDKFINDCRYIIDIMKSNDQLYYFVNKQKMSLYQIMKLYNSVTPSNIQRYKGLGEMDKEELAESTLYPGSDRTLIRYTMEDIKETLNTIREFESNPKKILGEVGYVTRTDLID